jgi:hypothetical protein
MTAQMAPVKTRLGVPPTLQSCHTAEIGGYIIEGHVPVEAIQRLLREKPANVVGIGVPGMVGGTPGMETPGQPAQPYEVVAWDKDGKSWVYERH